MEQMVQQSAALADQFGYKDGDMVENMRQIFAPVLMITTTIVYTIVSLIMSAFGAFLVNLRRGNENKNNDNKTNDNKDSNIKQQN
jgi:heme/copper-type cytochrome/quinol oxidase subunit 2